MDTDGRPPSETRELGVVPPILIGAGCAVLGLLPWLLGGMQLPLQNLWSEPTPPDQMPRALLPFSQYAVAEITAMLGIGATAAGLVARRLTARLGRRGAFWLAAGLLLIQLAAVGQTALTVGAGLRVGTESTIYLAGLTGIAVTAVLLGLTAYALIAVAPPPGALIGLTLGAIALAYWMPTLLPYGSTAAAVAPGVQQVLSLVSPALVGVAIAWCGLRGRAHAPAAIASLALLWVLPSALAGVQSALGSRALLRHPAELVQAWTIAFRLTLFGYSLLGVGIAVVIAAIALAARAMLGRRIPAAG